MLHVQGFSKKIDLCQHLTTKNINFHPFVFAHTIFRFTFAPRLRITTGRRKAEGQCLIKKEQKK